MANKRNIYNRYKANIGKLIAQYPNLFDKKDPKPLAIGMQDLLLGAGSANLGLSRTMIGDCLKVWTNREEYHRAVRQDGAIRYDLNMFHVELVSPEDQAHAARAHDALRNKRKKLTTVSNQEPHSRLKAAVKVRKESKKLFNEKVNKPLDVNNEVCKMADLNKAITPKPQKENEMLLSHSMQNNSLQLAVITSQEKTDQLSAAYKNMPTVANALVQRASCRDTFKARAAYLVSLVGEVVPEDQLIMAMMGLTKPPFFITFDIERLNFSLTITSTQKSLEGFDKIEQFLLEMLK